MLTQKAKVEGLFYQAFNLLAFTLLAPGMVVQSESTPSNWWCTLLTYFTCNGDTMRKLTFYSSFYNLRGERVPDEVKNTEKYVQEVLEDQNFKVRNLETSIHDAPTKIWDFLTKKHCEHNGRSYDSYTGRVKIDSNGLPDLIVWKESTGGLPYSVGFIEVKTDNDSLHTSQNKWMQKYSYYNTAVAWIEEKDQ